MRTGFEQHPTACKISVSLSFLNWIKNEMMFYRISRLMLVGVVGWCEGAVYLTSLGRPTDIGLQLGKACYPCSG